MENNVLPVFVFHFNRFHKALALGPSVAGIYVNVLAPEAFGAVIGVAAPLYKKTALFTSEILPGALEFFRRFFHKSY